ncbi:MAG: DUF4013 domain-containing protein [Methanobrevibacter sp.]|nr:DUF4013 domain-containing protein [Methanobrevibacter sp.]
MNVTNIIKTSLKYPQTSIKNVVIYTAFLILFYIAYSLAYATIAFNKLLQLMSYSNISNSRNLVFFNTLIQNNSIVFAISIICLIILLILIAGYIYRIYEGLENLPDFNNLQLLLVQGIKVIGLSIIYLIIPVAILLIGCSLYSNIGLLLIIIAIIALIILGLFILPIAMGIMVKNDDFKSALEFESIIEKIKEITLTNYVGAVILSLIAQTIIIISFLVISLLLIALTSIIPILGLIVAVICFIVDFFVFSYLQIFSIKVYQLLCD